MTSFEQLPHTIKGIEIYSRGTERLREDYEKRLKGSIERLCEKGNLIDLVFLSNVLDQWAQDADTLTRRCLVADLALQMLGGDDEPGFRREEIELSGMER